MSRFLHSVDKIIFLDGEDVRRAPMAAALFRRLAERDPVLSAWGIHVESAGTGKYTRNGTLPHAKATEAMLSIGIDISSHRSRTLTPSDIDQASIIVAMETKHEVYVDEKVCVYPASRSKVVAFYDYLGSPGDIPPLIGSTDLDEYVRFRELMDKLLGRLVVKLKWDTHLPLLARGQGFGTGVVQARATVINSSKAGNMSKGNVLVYGDNCISGRLAAMASAIVTDSAIEIPLASQPDGTNVDGGPVCTFDKPGVGGTIHATTVIEDGAMVIVDANRGLVYGPKVPNPLL